ncbi:CoA pyrophosphatase [Oleiagrimonas soli]|uniref:8-oxo-dGTP pyrophosphatase MutT (NUDIX family) n=1 Tax=Oleiagrimonas soli TaxID=1543381 RepID=A0A099CVE0_9GAMM|nr:CoA pyrophosphatase [Oleiagrimonas soli]KGI77918.1 NUDIX hydrolase [Oleiagrimonas soli]MBB6183715.1 8-oxo-dGTP pyrophosphatase MutT (NUDIX family) [Oleiagrimonas soli]
MHPRSDAWRQALRPLSEPPGLPGWNHATMSDLIGDAPLTPAAVLVPVIDAAQPSVVLTRRTEHLARHAGQVAFPGGRVDADDSDAIDAALRETEEEIGLPRSHVQPVGFLDCFETVSGFAVTPVVALVSPQRPPWRPEPGEVDEVFEVPLAFLLDPANLQRYTMQYRGQAREMAEFRYGPHRIWGATAAMLTNLLVRMGVLP